MFVPTFLFFIGMGCTTSFHLLWPLPAYLGLTVAMAGLAVRPIDLISRSYAGWAGWLTGWASLALVIISLYAGHMLPLIPPVRGAYGWNEMAAQAREEWQRLPAGSFVLGYSHPSYRCASQLAYHLRAPDQVYGNNVLGENGLQYQFWTDMNQLAGRDALVVIADSTDTAVNRALLAPWFHSVEFAGNVVITDGQSPRQLVRCALYRAHGYHVAAATAATASR
jgi:hypothetical protein